MIDAYEIDLQKNATERKPFCRYRPTRKQKNLNAVQEEMEVEMEE